MRFFFKKKKDRRGEKGGKKGVGETDQSGGGWMQAERIREESAVGALHRFSGETG